MGESDLLDRYRPNIERVKTTPELCHTWEGFHHTVEFILNRLDALNNEEKDRGKER